MCFSATASFSSAGLLAVVGGLCLHQRPRRHELPYALIPFLFGIQQLLEGLIWLTLRDHASAFSCRSENALTQGYSLFSQVFWPIFVPLAVGLLEATAWRRRAIALCALSGLTVGMYLLAAMIQRPVTAQLVAHHIAYDFDHSHVVTASILYFVGACAAPLFSSHRSVRLFGVAALASSFISYLIFETWFISVWCYFAGLMSCFVLLHFSSRDAKPLLRWG